MTLEQVKYLREQLNKDNGKGKPIANSVFFDLDNGMAFRNNGDFVLFDDEHELLHCIAANRNNFVKHETPYCLYSAGYEMLQFTEANLTIEGLFMILDNMFNSIATDSQIKHIKTWAQNLPVKPMNGVNNTYFMDPAPKIPQRPITPIIRDDGVTNGYPVISENNTSDDISTIPADKAAESITNMEDGESVFISGKTTLTDQNITANNITITGGDTNSEGTMTVSGNSITLKSISFTNDPESTNKNENILIIEGEDAIIENCDFIGTSEISVGIKCVNKNATFIDCTFDGSYGIYNGINLSPAGNAAVPLEYVYFKNCKFTKDFSNNNHVNMYDFADNAQVIFEDCYFEAGIDTNPIRFGNEGNGKNVTVIIKNCKYGKTELHGEYDGLILFQDHTKKADKEANGTYQDFSTWTVNIINLTRLNGEKVTENGSGIDRIYYCYGVDEGKEPVVNFS